MSAAVKIHPAKFITSARNLFTQSCWTNLRNATDPYKENDLNMYSVDVHKRKLIEMEMAIEKENGNFFIPEKVPEKHWDQLLKLKTPNERRHFYRYLKKAELHTEKRIENRIKKRFHWETLVRTRNSVNPGHIVYGLTKNSLFQRLSKKGLHKPYFSNLCDTVMFGQKLVIDLGYEDMMNVQELNNCLTQINTCLYTNKIHKEPFHLHLCNANLEGQLVQKIKSQNRYLMKPHPLVPITEKSYLELFPNDRIVYLSPHCDETLKEYNHDDVYILGGIVDRSRQGPVSLAKAKRENLHIAKLPLERHLNLNRVNTSLTLDQVMKILLTMKETLDWDEAFKHVPGRKINRFITMPRHGFSLKDQDEEKK